MLAKAQNLCASLEEQASAFENLDADITRAQAESLKLALSSGETHLPDDSHPEFAAQRIARENAQAHLRRVRSSLPLLEQELQQAQDEEKRCDLEREWAAVLAQEADALAAEFNEKIIELRRMSYLLQSMAFKQVRRAPNENTLAVPGHLYGNGPYRRITMSAAVNQAISEHIIGLHEQHFGFGMRNEAGHAVSVFWNELQSNPDATFNDEPQSPLADEHSEAAE